MQMQMQIQTMDHRINPVSNTEVESMKEILREK